MFDDVTTHPFGWMARQMPLLLLAYALVFIALAWWKRIYPHTSLLVVLSVASLLSFLLLASDELMIIILLIDTVVAVIAAIDLFTLPSKKAFAVERETMRVASLKKNHRVSLTITNK